MRRKPVVSTAVDSIGYDSALNVLEIEFADDGGVYRYYAVPPTVVQALLAADSIGRFVNQQIKPRYRAVPIE
jgi:hypothetical protein